jgi:hypothetical protein
MHGRSAVRAKNRTPDPWWSTGLRACDALEVTALTTSSVRGIGFDLR